MEFLLLERERERGNENLKGFCLGFMAYKKGSTINVYERETQDESSFQASQVSTRNCFRMKMVRENQHS